MKAYRQCLTDVIDALIPLSGGIKMDTEIYITNINTNKKQRKLSNKRYFLFR